MTISLNYVNLARRGRVMRGQSTPGFHVGDAKVFVGLGKVFVWAAPKTTRISSKIDSQDRRAMELYEDPRVISAALSQVRSGSTENIVRTLKILQEAK